MSRRWRVVALFAALTLLAAASAAAVKSFVVSPLDDDRYVVLVMGSDQGPFRSGQAIHGRSDGLHLVTILPKEKRVTILSFARDSWVDVPGFGRTKINAALTRGPATAVKTMENLTGITIDDWVVTSFKGLRNAVNQIGGLTIDVEQRLNDPFGARSDLRPGKQQLSGKQALAYARDRKSRPNGDFGRSKAQAKMMAAMHRQLRASGQLGLGDALEYAAIFQRNTESSIGTRRLMELARVMVGIRPGNVERRLVHGVAGTAGAASVVYITDRGRALIADVRQDGVIGKLGR